MEIGLRLGGINIRIDSERILPVASSLKSFVCTEDYPEDVRIVLTWDWDNSRHPKTKLVGEDLLLEYYHEDTVWFCQSKGGKAPVTCACYTDDFRRFRCAVNERPFLEPPKTLERIFSFFPMRALFLHFRVLFLHASQISIGGTGIVFSAPSGTGKTTQAKLWEKYMGAEIVCNDRVLMREERNIWKTYGYPIDGSEPVRSSAVKRLGCIVLLRQGKNNQVIHLPITQAASMLMEQAVIDGWNPEARADTIKLLLDILDDIPVYLQICTPDFRAADQLRSKLIQEGVLGNGGNYEETLG